MLKLCLLQLRLTLTMTGSQCKRQQHRLQRLLLPSPLDDEVVTLSEEYFLQFFVGDTVNLAALSKAVNVSHEFLAGYGFEHGLGQPVSEIQAAAALEGDQLVTPAVAAREEEVPHFQKLGPLLQEKIQFLCERGWCHPCLSCQPSEPLSSVLELSSGSYACHSGKCLFLIAQFVSIRGLKEVVLWTFQGSGSVALVEQFGVRQRGTNATKVGSRAVLAAVLPGVLLTLIPKGTVGGLPQGFPGSSPLNPGMVHGPFRSWSTS